MKTGICKNCGADYMLHHYMTMQCPVGGREETRANKEQEWKDTTFESQEEFAEKGEKKYKKLRLKIAEIIATKRAFDGMSDEWVAKRAIAMADELIKQNNR